MHGDKKCHVEDLNKLRISIGIYNYVQIMFQSFLHFWSNSYCKTIMGFPTKKYEQVITFITRQGCKFSDLCLISENLTSKYLKMFFEISSL